MALLFSKEIINAVDAELRNAKQSVQIISAYCKEDAIRKLDSKICPSIKNKRIMIRFRMDDILRGSSDFSVLKYCLDNGWKVYIRFDLHAKTYIVDDKRGIVGSANATKSGLTGNASGNAEMATLVEIEQQDKEKIEKLFVEAIEVEEKLVDEFSKQLNAVKDTSKIESVQWSKEIRELFHPNIETLFSYELPEKTEYQSGDYIQFLDAIFGDDSEVIKEKFRWSNAYLWLLNVIEKKGGEIYFGELSAELHNALIEDPKPYRKDVKILLVNMLSLIEAWNMEEIIVDRPNFSQRIRLNKKN